MKKLVLLTITVSKSIRIPSPKGLTWKNKLEIDKNFFVINSDEELGEKIKEVKKKYNKGINIDIVDVEATIVPEDIIIELLKE